MTPAHYPVCLPVQGTPLVPLGPHLLCSEPEEILPGRLYHGATGFLFMADSSAPADQHHRFLIQSTIQTASKESLLTLKLNKPGPH